MFKIPKTGHYQTLPMIQLPPTITSSAASQCAKTKPRARRSKEKTEPSRCCKFGNWFLVADQAALQPTAKLEKLA